MACLISVAVVVHRNMVHETHATGEQSSITKNDATLLF